MPGREVFGSEVGQRQGLFAQQGMAGATEQTAGKRSQRVDRQFFAHWQIACVGNKEIELAVLQVLQQTQGVLDFQPCRR